MKVILRSEQSFHKEAERAHEETLKSYDARVAEIEETNSEIEQANETRQREHAELIRRREEWRPPRGLRGLMSRNPKPPEVPPAPEPIPLIPTPPEPEYQHAGPTTYTVEQLPDDYESDDAEQFKMIGPIRVLPGEWILTNDETGRIHKVAQDDFERDWVEV